MLKTENISKKLDKDITYIQAYNMAKAMLKEKLISLAESDLRARLDKKNYVYINGVETSDLIVVIPRLNKKGEIVVDAKGCTDEEWKEFYYTFICPAK